VTKSGTRSLPSIGTEKRTRRLDRRSRMKKTTQEEWKIFGRKNWLKDLFYKSQNIVLCIRIWNSVDTKLLLTSQITLNLCFANILGFANNFCI